MTSNEDIARDILRSLAQPAADHDDVFQVDAEPRSEWNGKQFLDIELDSGDTLRLTIEVIDEE